MSMSTTPINQGPPTADQGKKKTSPIVFILAGCGGLIVIGGIVFAVAMYFVYNKAKQMGLDPELMKKSPAMAVAKFVAATNPDVEVLSSDEANATITVKDKKTGKVITVSLDDAKNGNITVKEDGKDAVKIQAKGDGESGSIEVKSGEGSMKIGNTGDKLPDWIPAYPGSTAIGTYSFSGNDAESGGFHFTTSDSAEKVILFYESELKKSDMKVQTFKTDQAGTITGEDSGKKRSVTVTAGTSEQGTQVTVAFNIKK